MPAEQSARAFEIWSHTRIYLVLDWRGSPTVRCRHCGEHNKDMRGRRTRGSRQQRQNSKLELRALTSLLNETAICWIRNNVLFTWNFTLKSFAIGNSLPDLCSPLKSVCGDNMRFASIVTDICTEPQSSTYGTQVIVIQDFALRALEKGGASAW